MNTDDPGVFDTDLPTEYAHLAAHNGMDNEGIAKLACRAVQVGNTEVSFSTGQHMHCFVAYAGLKQLPGTSNASLGGVRWAITFTDGLGWRQSRDFAARLSLSVEPGR